MTLRKRRLPAGWYPVDETRSRAFLRGAAPAPPSRQACAALAPHAGWAYSGAVAALSFASLSPETDTVALIGGHLRSGAPALFFEEDGVETPFGPLMIDGALRDGLASAFAALFPQGIAGDRYPDNTVEVLLPMAAFFFPKARILPLRLPEERASFAAGSALARLGKSLNRTLAVVGSTDLTHYGENYGFTPRGTGAEALRWVREVNDKAFIEAVLAGSPPEILRCALEGRAACSAGAALCAAGFAQAVGAGRGELLAYRTSADAGENADCFVGYAAVAWGKVRSGAAENVTGDGI
ncbi:MAG: AmmeMemoRadiSam system protein B [Spirochaetaceae bacterium]|nr:AmmeMemoRadiSam system protein B [Spirochaetaceae bacterium]